MMFKTVVIQVNPDQDTEECLVAQAKESARWMNAVFRKLYADKRNGRWEMYGPERDWGQKYGTIVQERKGGWIVNGNALYPAFIRKDAPGRVPTNLSATMCHALARNNVATVWGNFLGPRRGKVPNPKGRLPRFNPVSKFRNRDVWFEMVGSRLVLDVPHFLEHRSRLRIPVVHSGDPNFVGWIAPLLEFIGQKNTPSVEFRQHDDGKWYAHIHISVEAARPKRQPEKVVGVDFGERVAMTAVMVEGEEEIPEDALLVPNTPLVHRLERVQSRMRQLRSKADRGSRGAREALKRLKGKRVRMQDTHVKQTAYRVAEMAAEVGAEGIAVENLRGMRSPGWSKTLNRRMGQWKRGQAREVLAHKAKERGLKFVEVYPHGTSSTCPFCGKGYRNAVREGVRDLKARRFTCKECGYSNHDDVVGAINIARRGWRYWHSTKWNESQSNPVAGTTGNDSPGNGVGESSIPQTKPTDVGGPVNATYEKPGNPTDSYSPRGRETSRVRPGRNSGQRVWKRAVMHQEEEVVK